VLSNFISIVIMDLICKICKKEYQTTPVILPCGWTVCESHVNNNEIVACVFCGKSHFTSDGTQYNVNRSIEIHLNQKKLKDGLTRTDFKLTYFKVLQSDPYSNYIFKYFDSLINKITARENELVASIKNHFGPMIVMLKSIRDKSLDSDDQESLNAFKSIDLGPFIEQVNYLKNEKNDDLKVDASSNFTELDAKLKENRKRITAIERALDESLDSLLENTTYELSEKMKSMDYDELFGKLIITNKSKPTYLN
jgi:hypothetical protein